MRADSGCFSEQLDDATNECLENGVDMMERENAKLQLLKVDKFIVANNMWAFVVWLTTVHYFYVETLFASYG